MNRHEFSYWLRLEGSVSIRKKAHEWLHSRGIVPDSLQLVVSDEENVSSYEVPDGTIEETQDMWNALDEMAKNFPALVIYFDELDEEDHSIERHTYWHNGKHAVEHAEISNEMLRLKAEDLAQYRVRTLIEQFKKALLNRGDSADKAEQLAIALACGYPEDDPNTIYFHLSIEGNQDDCLAFSQSLCQHPVLMRKEFLWPTSQQVGLYVGRGNAKTAKEVVDFITTAVEALPDLIVFLEEEHEPTTYSKWHCWNSGCHVCIDAADGILYESELDLRELLLDMCQHPEKYLDEAAQIKNITHKENAEFAIPRLSGGYCLVRFKDSVDTDNGDFPVLLAVKEDFLQNVAGKSGFKNLEDFYANYDTGDMECLENLANQQHCMAFAYNEETGEFSFPETMMGDGVLALIDFISGKLQENGFEDASKYLDCLFEL